MFCPKCATQNIEGASYCRSCGANISLVPHALTGQLPSQTDHNLGRYTRRTFRRQPTAEHGIAQIISGLGFLAVALCVAAFAPAGRIWWFWMLIPAFSLLGKGISQIVSAKYGPSLTQRTSQTAMSPVARTGELPPRNEVLFPPPSVTEQTTRQLDPKTDPYRYRDTDTH